MPPSSPPPGEEERVSEQVEEVLELLRSQGGRVTTSRRLLLRHLFETSAHITAEDIAEMVHAEAPDVHLSTIYRNLDELERLGIVSHSHLGHGPAIYHLSSSVHGHLVCEDCGITIEAPDALFSELATHVGEQFGFSIDPHHFAILGQCATCREKGTAEHVHEAHLKDA